MTPDYQNLGGDFNALYGWTVIVANNRLRQHPHLKTTPKDIAQEAMLHMHAYWDARKCSAEAHIVMRIKHEIDSLLRSYETKNTDYAVDSNIVDFPDGRPNQEQIAIARSEERRLYDYVGSRHLEARRLAEWIIREDCKTSAEIADLMRVSPSHVDHLKRTLKRIIIDYAALPENAGSELRRMIMKMGEAK